MLKKIPYGISSFKQLIDKNLYYIDKTSYIEKLENKPDFHFFIRPRRFGKSLFLTMLETYYDINEKVNFEKYFGEMYIGKNKTPEANKYLVVTLSFSNVISDQGKEQLIESFDEIVAGEIESIFEKYASILKGKKLPQNKQKATYAMDFLKRVAKGVNAKVVLLIDEYDNFANNIMSSDKNLYEELVHGDGYVRTFYKGIKEGTRDGVITRTFVTGVSPIMLDDITSGANIFEIISNDADLNEMLGFTDSDLEDIIKYYEIDKKVDRVKLMDILKNYCNGYKFNKKTSQTVYNTDMVLYLLKNIIATGEYPDNLIDENVKTDYARLRKIAEFFVSKDHMNEIIESGKVGPVEIKDRFNLESLYSKEEKEKSINSLLYYMGMLTIDYPEENKVFLKIPNYAIKQLYWEYIQKIYEIDEASKYKELIDAMRKMRMEGNIDDIMSIYAKVINRLSTRDLTHFNEASCKCIFITLVFTDGIYLIESEREANGGYSDLYIKEGIFYKEYVKYRYMIEFKNIKRGELKGDINALSKEECYSMNSELIADYKEKAKSQLEQYMEEHNVINDSDRILKKFSVITIGRKYVEFDIL